MANWQKSMFEEIEQRQREAATACEEHSFSPDKVAWCGMVRCRKCGWIISHQEAELYYLGHQHGRRSFERDMFGC